MREVSLRKTTHAALIGRFIADERGATAIDYGVLTCVVALVVVAFAGSGLSFGTILQRVGILAEVLVGDVEVSVPLAEQP
jgi:Flp pilus assembly pilin Flp